MSCTITSWLMSGLPRQFMVMNENRLCSNLFHLLVPGLRHPSAPQHLCLGDRERSPLSFIQMRSHQFPTLCDRRLCLYLAGVTEFRKYVR